MDIFDPAKASYDFKEAEILNLRIAEFMRRYRPSHEDDAQEACRFEADLFGLIRAAHMQATEPFARRLADAMKLQPLFPFTLNQKP